MATALILGGSSPSPRGLIPPAPDGVAGWFEFASTDQAVALRNLRNPQAPGTLLGAPTFAGGYAAFPAVPNAGIDSHLVPTANYGILALARRAAAPASSSLDRGYIISNSVGSGATEYNQTTLMLDENVGGTAVAATYASYASSTGALSAAASSPGGFADWVLVFGGTAGGYQIAMNLTANTLQEATRADTREADNLSLLIGSSRAALSQPMPVHIAALCIWTSRHPTRAEIIANAKLMQARAAAAGITVALGATA